MTTTQSEPRDSPARSRPESATLVPPGSALDPLRTPARHDSHDISHATGQGNDATNGQRDFWTDAGILVVGLTAGTISWAAWSHLADMVGMSGTLTLFNLRIQLAWLLPIAVDVFLITATRVWQSHIPAHDANPVPLNPFDDQPDPDDEPDEADEGTDPILRFARGCSLGAMAASVAANGAYHALTLAAGVHDPRSWISMVTAALPPVMLALVAHLRAMLTSERRHAERHAERRRYLIQLAHARQELADPEETTRQANLVKDEKTVKANLMRAFFKQCLHEGHIPAGAEMAEYANASGSHARTVRRDLIDALPRHLRPPTWRQGHVHPEQTPSEPPRHLASVAAQPDHLATSDDDGSNSAHS